ncbi:MAG: hypothetical protein IPG71_00945 [bacterium]|nr:hypothetical protein [bacterium]
MARWATFVQRHQDPTANWLTVDAGNFVDRAGATGGCSNKCQFLVNSYEDLHYDVLNIARQEVSMGYETLVALRDTTKTTKYVAANLIDEKSKRPIFDPYVIKDYGNMRVAILGLLRDADFPATTSLVDTTKMRVTSTADAAAKYIPELARKANAVVLLCELPSDDVDSLVAKYPDIDIIISTGALRQGETTTIIGKKTRLVGTGSSGYNGHYATLEFKPAWGDSIGYSDFKDALLETYDIAGGDWATRLAAFEGASKTPPPVTSGVRAVPNANPSLSPEAHPATPGTSTSHDGHSHG